MIPRRRLLTVSLLAAAALLAGGPALVSLAPRALARDGEKDDGKGKGEKGGGKGKDGKEKDKKEEKEKDPKDTPEGKEVVAVGAEFQRKDSAALVARIRPKGKARINLSGTSAEYGRDQASAVLDEWFKEKEISKVEFKSVKDLQGELTVTWRARGSDTAEKRTLLVTLEQKAKAEGYWLTRLELL